MRLASLVLLVFACVQARAASRAQNVQLRLAPSQVPLALQSLDSLNSDVPGRIVDQLARRLELAPTRGVEEQAAAKAALWMLVKPAAIVLPPNAPQSAQDVTQRAAELSGRLNGEKRARSDLRELANHYLGLDDFNEGAQGNKMDTVFDGSKYANIQQAVERNDAAAVRAMIAAGANPDVMPHDPRIQGLRDGRLPEAGIELMLGGTRFFADSVFDHRISNYNALIELGLFGRYMHRSYGQHRFIGLMSRLSEHVKDERLRSMIPARPASPHWAFDREFASFLRFVGFADALASALDKTHAAVGTWEERHSGYWEDGDGRHSAILPEEISDWTANKISPLFLSMMEKTLRELADARDDEAKGRARLLQQSAEAAAAMRRSHPGLNFGASDTADPYAPWTQAARRLEPYRRSDAQNVVDVVREFTIYAVLPELLRRHNAAGMPDNVPLAGLMERLLPVVGRALFGAERAVDKVLGISERWHALRDTVLGGDGAENDPGKIRTRTRRGDWKAIAPKFIVPDGPAKGFQVVNLVSSMELDAEGDRKTGLNHCVGGYASSCLSGDIHIFSIRDAQGARQSTFGLRVRERAAPGALRADDILPPRSGKMLSADGTNLGHSNSRPSDLAQAAFAQFKKAIEEGQISLDLWRITKDDGAAPADLAEEIGFTPSIEKNNQVFRLFQESRFKARIYPDGRAHKDEAGNEVVEQANHAHFTPSGFKGRTAQQFFDESGVGAAAMAALEAALKKALPKVPL